MLFKKTLGFASAHEEVFACGDLTSAAMKAAVAQWYQMYYQAADTAAATYTQRIPYAVVEALCAACFCQYGASVPGGQGKAQLLNRALEKLDSVRHTAFQQALIGGEVFLKPVPRSGGFDFCVVSRPGYLVLGRDPAGAITAVGTREVSWVEKKQYTLYEKRCIGGDGRLEICSKLYESRTPGAMGRRVPLDTIEKYAHLRESLILPRPVGLGMIHMRTPFSNCVDQSHDGVSVFAAAAGKIAAAARHEARCEDEYRLTRPHVIASVDIVRRGKNGRDMEIPEYIVPIVDDDPASAGLTVYNPAPNQGPLEARMQQHLRDIENIVGLRRGMLSGVESAERTATEVAATNARYAATVAALCEMWRQAAEQTVHLCDALGQMYLGWSAAPAPPLQASFGDGVLYDADAEFQRLLQCVSQGILPKEELVRWMAEHR